METNKIYQGDCIEELKKLPDNSVDAIITDPPYGLEFMGKEWDKFKNAENIGGGTMENRNTPYQRGEKTPPAYYIWTLEQKNEFQIFSMNWAKECLRVLKPGGFLLSFGGTRTYHRMTCGIEDAGFEIRDTIMWVYGSGFPKSLNIGKAVDKMQGNEREVVFKNPYADGHIRKATGNISDANDNVKFLSEYKLENGLRKETKGTSEWEGWGTALKPAVEPIVVARKPLSEKNVALNVLKWGTGGINIDECRIGFKGEKDVKNAQVGFKQTRENIYKLGITGKDIVQPTIENGRFPANIILEKSYQQVYTLKESFINLIPLLNIYYGNEYMFKMQKEISGLSLQEEGKSWKILQSEMLQPTSESEIQRKESSNVGEETNPKVKEFNEQEQNKEIWKGESNIQRGMDEQGIQVSQYSRINTFPEDFSKTNDEQRGYSRTQNNNGNLSEQTIKERGSGSSQEWSEERQQNREFRDDEQFNTQERTQRDFKRIKNIAKGERGFIICDCDLPKEWREYFESTIIEIDYPFSSSRMLDKQTGNIGCSSDREKYKGSNYGTSMFLGDKPLFNSPTYTDKGGASRFFYVAKASKSERNFGCEGKEEIVDCDRNPECYSADVPFNRSANPKKNNHPTVKPIKLMEYLIKLVSKENAVILDPFLGSGTTAIACLKLNRKFIGIEKEEEYVKIAQARIKPYLKQIQLNSEEAVLETII